MNNLIEPLKNNERAFGLCSKEEQACFHETGKDNCDLYHGLSEWGSAVENVFDSFYWESTYRIKAGYQPELEIEWCVVSSRYGRIGFQGKSGWTAIHKAISYTNFHGSKWADGTTSTELRREVKGKPAEYPVVVGFLKGK